MAGEQQPFFESQIATALLHFGEPHGHPSAPLSGPAAVEHVSAYKPRQVLIEDTGVGTTLIPELRKMPSFPLSR